MKLLQNSIDCTGFLCGTIFITSFFDETPTNVSAEIYYPNRVLVGSGQFTKLSAHTFAYEFESNRDGIGGTYYLVISATTQSGKRFLSQYEVELEEPAPDNLGV